VSEDTAVLAIQERGRWPTVYISAATRDLLTEFIDGYVRAAGSLKRYYSPAART